MSEISKIYNSDQLLIKVGGRKGKTSAQIMEMLERQKPGYKKSRKPKAQGKKAPSKKSSSKMTLKEVMTLLKLSQQEVFQLVESGQLPVFKLKGKKILFNRNAINNFITKESK